MKVDFYHLTQSPVEAVLPQIAAKLLQSSARLLVVSEDAAQIVRMDEALWSYRPDSFLPHGTVDSAHAAAQPVLLSTRMDPQNGAQNVALADGIWREEALGFERVFYLFDQNTIEGARGAWRSLGENADVSRHFWKQDERGKWQVGP